MPPKIRQPRKDRSFIERARRAQIVEAAVEVIAEVGYPQASLERIAQRVGISRGLISYHFAGRDELIAEVVAGAFATGAEFMRPRVESQREPAAMLRAYLESNLAFMREHRRHMVALVSILTNTGDHGATSADAVIGDLQRILGWGQQTGAFRPFDTRVMAIAIRNAIDGVPVRLTIEPDLDLDHYTTELVTLFDLATRKDPS